MNLLIYWGYKKVRIPLSSFLQTCSSINIFNIKQTWYFLYINPKKVSGNADKYDIRRKILKLKKVKKHGIIYKLHTLQKMRTNSKEKNAFDSKFSKWTWIKMLLRKDEVIFLPTIKNQLNDSRCILEEDKSLFDWIKEDCKTNIYRIENQAFYLQKVIIIKKPLS